MRIDRMRYPILHALRRAPCGAVLMGLWLSLSAMPAHADACATGVTMLATTVAFSPNYDFTDPVQHTIVVTSLRIMGVVNGCTYFVGAEGGNSGGRSMSNGSATMNYQLYTDSALTEAFVDPLNGAAGSAANMPSFTGGTQSTVMLTYYFSIPASQYIPSGPYQDDVLLTLYDGTFLAPSPPIDTVSANHEVTVSGIFLMSIVPAGNAFDVNQSSATMDFGDLSPGQSLNVQALFKSNNAAGYKLYMHSDNSGQLKLAGGTATAPYSLQMSSSGSPNLADVAGSPALTSTDMQIASGTGVAPATADRLNVAATIGDFNAVVQAPGTYSDVITVTIVGN